MKSLIVIDVQNGFVTSKTKWVLPRLEQLLVEFEGELIIATQFINKENSGFTDIMHWNRLKSTPETSLIPFVEQKATFIVEKTTYSACIPEVMDILNKMGINEVYLAGIDTDCCVLATAISLFECNIRPVVLAHYCASNGGERSHAAALTVLERTIGAQQIIESPYCVDR